jgi:hypothetical protein
MRGDRVEIVVDAGGVTNNYEVAATRAGRRVEVVNRRGMIEVSELTRGGTPVRTARFMASRVIALVEHPAPRRAAEAEERRSGAPATGEERRSGAPATRGEPRSGAPAATGERRAAAS